MKSVKKVVTVSCLYVGAIVGAGFATGREIMQYFSSIYSAVAAGFLLGISAIIFLYAGKERDFIFNKYHNGKIFKAFINTMKVTVAICTYLSFAVMCSGLETLMRETLNIKFIGLAIGLIISFASLANINNIKIVNAILVPIIVITMCVLVMMNKNIDTGSGFSPLSVLTYAAMNLTLGGCLMLEEGKGMNKKELISTAIVCGVFIAILVGIGYAVSSNFRNDEMPVYMFARSHNVGVLSAVVIFIAILTTLLSCAKVVMNEGKRYLPRYVFVILLAVTAILFFKVDFKMAVNKIYPIISAIGLAYSITMTGYCLFIFICKRRS